MFTDSISVLNQEVNALQEVAGKREKILAGIILSYVALVEKLEPSDF